MSDVNGFLDPKLPETAVVRTWVSERLERELQKVPEHMRDCVRAYVLQGQLDDDFLTAVLSNDLKGAFIHADEINTAAMRAWVGFVINALPTMSQGSAETVAQWVAYGGFDGMATRQGAPP